jgi:hypothetical protein
MKSKRTLALEWWQKMTTKERMKAVENWKQNTEDIKKEWDFVIISMSSSTIQQIWEEQLVTEINK